jgi:NAD(P)-dependent dehydrogenase (short-subunit alcohol dehydrogenase family)
MNEFERTCIITGANSGIGKSAAFQIAGKGLRVILACRNIAQAEAVCTQIKSKTGNAEVFARKVDLSLVADAKRFAREFAQEFGSLNILINNAADFDLSRKKPLLTAEGNEVQFATNLLSPFVLMQELLPLMEQGGNGKIINIGTQGLIAYPNIIFDFDNICGQKSYSPDKVYYQTKLGLLMISLALRRRVTDSSVSVYAVRVANVKVDISRYPDISPLLKTMYQLKSRFSISPEDMAKVYTILTTEEKSNGFYYDEKVREVHCNKNAYDIAAQERLWQLCEQLSELHSES